MITIQEEQESAPTFDGFKTFLACVARLQTREDHAALRRDYGGYFATAAAAALAVAARRDQLSKEELQHVYR